MEKFLKFNGRNILFIAKEGQFWVAIKPICDALGVDYIRQFKNLKEDKILSQLLSEQTMVAADNRLRKMLCLPEKYVYGWLFTIQSSSPELMEYKLMCYNILYDHFQGSITKRQEILLHHTSVNTKISQIKGKLFDNPDFRELQQLIREERQYKKQLKELDVELLQLEIFE